METNQTTLGEYLQTRIGAKYEPRKMTQEYILESFWLHDLSVNTSRSGLMHEIERYYVGKGMQKSFGRGWDLSFEGDNEDLVGITLSKNDLMRKALVTVNNLRKTSEAVSSEIK